MLKGMMQNFNSGVTVLTDNRLHLSGSCRLYLVRQVRRGRFCP